MRARLRLPVVVLPVLLCGCFGGAANPSYFPYYLPPGDVIPTHAKPAGRGYFADFDPNAVKLDLTPGRTTAPVGSQQVFVATVLDAEGNARRKRRVEWILDGPGYIVEVDESGITAGRGYLVNNQRAVSYTGHFAHTFDRGTESTKDDFCVDPGQTWCVVSSAKPGETTVTAYAPAIHNADERQVIARVTWAGPATTNRPTEPAPPAPPPKDKAGLPPGPGADEFTPVPPPGKTVAAGDSLTLDVRAPRSARPSKEFVAVLELANTGKKPGTAATLALDVPAGAEIIKADPPAATTTADRMTWKVDGIPPDGTRRVTLTVRPARNGPLTLAATADTVDGAKASQKATVSVGTPRLSVSARTPAAVAPGDRVTVPVTVTNDATTPADGVSVYVSLPSGVEHTGGQKTPELRVGSVPAGGSQTVDLPLVVRIAGTSRVVLNAQGGAGESARGEFTVTARAADPEPSEPPAPPEKPAPPPDPGRPALALEWAGLPPRIARGQTVTARVRLTNRGTGPADNVDVTVAGENVRAARGTDPDRRPGDTVGGRLTFPALATLAPGDTATFTVELTGTDAGPARAEAVATPRGGRPVREDVNVRVTRGARE